MDAKQGPEVAWTGRSIAKDDAALTVRDLVRIVAGLPVPDSSGGLFDEIRDLEDLESAPAGRQGRHARHAASFDLSQRREQAYAGVPAKDRAAGRFGDDCVLAGEFGAALEAGPDHVDRREAIHTAGCFVVPPRKT